MKKKTPPPTMPIWPLIYYRPPRNARPAIKPIRTQTNTAAGVATLESLLVRASPPARSETIWKRDVAPREWAAIHTAAYAAKTAADRRAFAALVAAVIARLPCGRCRKKSTAFLAANPVPTDPTQLGMWSVNWHNEASADAGKSIWTAAQGAARWRR